MCSQKTYKLHVSVLILIILSEAVYHVQINLNKKCLNQLESARVDASNECPNSMFSRLEIVISIDKQMNIVR